MIFQADGLSYINTSVVSIERAHGQAIVLDINGAFTGGKTKLVLLKDNHSK
jgi:hypothetical protein